ncbi:hybrid sensor histidine kinase/response regulator [Neolewinella persica]|uniref:hybrid sensor histidine kinase/response regulator n=1 Tax=Neolewinella persica TaxID=70998 RepID=UPI00037828BD|nr:hybrid sensor histidine kinase/response regulator transcription factor [Neolewinella persica]
MYDSIKDFRHICWKWRRLLLTGAVVGGMLLLQAGGITAQDSLNVFSTISSAEAFSINPITSIDQDDRGVLWFGSRNGLLRYDGRQLKRMPSVIATEAHARMDDITDIEVSRDGKIWVATFSGLFQYDPEYGTFTVLEDLIADVPETMPSAIFCVAEVAGEKVWIGARTGVFVCDMLTGEVRKLPAVNAMVNQIYQMRNGDVWVGTAAGLLKFPAGSEKASVRIVNDPTTDGLRNNEVLSLLEDKHGNLWVGTVAGLDYLEVANNRIKRLPGTTTGPLGTAVIRTLIEDNEGRVWIGSFNGIYVLSEGGAVDVIRHNPRLDNSLSDNKIRALFRDENGSVWVGSYYGGINLWDSRQLSFRHFGEANGIQLGTKVVSSVATDTSGRIYFGTEGKGVTVFDPEKQTFSRFNTTGLSGEPLGTVKCLQPDRPDRLWIGTFGKGLVRYNPLTQRGTFLRYNAQASGSDPNNVVLSLAIQGEDYLWIGLMSGGLDRIDLRTNEYTHIYKASLPAVDTLWHGAIRIMRFAKNGDLLLGTSLTMSRIAQKDLALSDFKPTWITIKNASGKKFAVSDIKEDDRGVIWVGTMANGLYRISGNALLREEIPAFNTVFAVVPEAGGEGLWLSTDEGIVYYQPLEGKSRLYREEDGLQKNEFSRTAGLQDRHGNVYFGGASGVTFFRPDRPKSFRLDLPDVMLTELRLFNQPLVVADSTGILEKNLDYTKAITLGHAQNRFSLHFALPSYLLNNKTVYRFRLLGLDDQWTTSSAASASYTIQRGGDYRFQVEASSADGRTTGITELAIEVKHPPWRSWWAYTLYALGILATVFLIVKANSRRIRLEHTLELEAREHQRMKEANDQKLRLFTNISHEFRTPLTLILGSLERVLENFRGSSKLYRQLQVVDKNASHLSRLVNELLDFRKLEHKQMVLQAAEGNMVKFVRELHLSFRQQAKDQQIVFQVETPVDEIGVYYDRDKFEKVLYNLISNAFKHTPAGGSITVEIRPETKRLIIVIKDTGTGIPAGEQDKIFERFYMVPDQGRTPQFSRGSGIGLAIVRNVVELHHGTISVESEPGAGSSFVVSLPLGREHLTDAEIIGEFRNSEDISGYEVPVRFESAELPVEDEDRAFVLIAEDNEEVGRFIKDILRPHYRVKLVPNGRIGYEQAVAHQPDLIISDVMMPEMDGITFCERIKEDIRTSHIPFVLLTARTSLIHKYDGLDSGADDYLNKPFKVKELRLKCHNILQTRERVRRKFSAVETELALGPVQNSLDEELMKKAAIIVRENLANQAFNVNDFASKLAVSRTLLFTKFKAWTGQTPNAYLLELRMKKAAQLIEQRKFNVSEVGYQVGYKDPGYFSKAFKKRFGLSPKAYGMKFMDEKVE